MKNKMRIIILVFALFWTALAAETGKQMMDRVRERSLWIDGQRFTTSVLLDFINTRQRMIATIGKTKEKDSVIVPAVGVRKIVLPPDFYLVAAVELNPNPQEGIGEATNIWTVLEYVPREQLGRFFTTGDERPSAYSIWGDSLILNRETTTGLDTLIMMYFAFPVVLSDSTDTIDLPDEWLPLLEDYLIKMCFTRVNLIVPDTLDRNIQYLENILIGRPRDE